jgi:hypothetical protein
MMRRQWLPLLVAAITASACSNPVSTCSQSNVVSGQWTYSATRESPVAGTITGTLVLQSMNCVDVQGVIDVVEVLTTGETQHLAGPVSGTVVDSTVVRFEAVLGGGSREHFARLSGDSLSGTWIETAVGAPGAGPFSGRRQGGN